MNSPQVSITGDLASAVFDRFDLDAYDLFLRCKALPESQLAYDYERDSYLLSTPARFAGSLGVPVPPTQAEPLALADFLFDDQQFITKLALDLKRFAVWSDCGLGKTPILLEWARHVSHRTGGRVLIITLGDIIPQTVEMARDFYGDELPIHVIETRAELRQWCLAGAGSLAITNYEKMNPDVEGQVVKELRHLSGLILDESSRLKTGGGKQKWAIIKSSRGIPFKLSCTATPAPNDVMEFASQASFLEKMRSENEIIWTFFRRDPVTNEWTVKPHARQAFFEWMASWSIYMRDPRRYGWRLDFEPPPPPVLIEHRLEMTPTQHKLFLAYNADRTGQMAMFSEQRHGMVTRGKLSQIAKGFIYEGGHARRVESHKPAFVADLIRGEVRTDLQVLVWTVFDEESDILAEALRALGFKHFDVLSGAIPKHKRQPILERFRMGVCPVLISKATLLGYGMNFQMCGSMIFSGWNDSYEQFYQAVRRAVRYKQVRRVRVHVPFIPELEGAVLENVLRKQRQFEEAVAEQEEAYIVAMRRLQLTGAAA